ncbi:MAG: hypothetical protein AB7V42_02240 [Thermoleophilia bacterium]
MTGRSRRRTRLVGSLLGLAALAATVPAANAATSSANITVGSGALTLATTNFAAANAALTGAAQTISTNPTAPWTATDARGTGDPWTVVASATDLVSAGTPDRVIPSANLAITTGTVTAVGASDPATGITGVSGSAFTVPTGAGQTDVALLSATANHRGSYDFSPQLDITVPATALASYPGVPYTSTITLTIS